MNLDSGLNLFLVCGMIALISIVARMVFELAARRFSGALTWFVAGIAWGIGIFYGEVVLALSYYCEGCGAISMSSGHTFTVIVYCCFAVSVSAVVLYKMAKRKP